MQALVPLQHQRLEFRDLWRPLVGALQPKPRRIPLHKLKRRHLQPQVQLLSPVGAPSRELIPQAGIAPEMGRIGHLDRQFLRLRQREEAARGRKQLGGELIGHAVADQVEEPNVARGGAQCRKKAAVSDV